MWHDGDVIVFLANMEVKGAEVSSVWTLTSHWLASLCCLLRWLRYMKHLSQAELLPMSFQLFINIEIFRINFTLPLVISEISRWIQGETRSAVLVQIQEPGFALSTLTNNPMCQQQPWTRWNAHHLRSQRDQKTQSDLGKSMKQQRVTASQAQFIFVCAFVQVASLQSADGATNVIWGEMRMLLKASTIPLWRKTLCGEAAPAPEGAGELKVS